jgi:hypothetical protein
MAVQSWHNKPQDIAHKNGPDIARTGGRPKNLGVPPVHPHMAERTNTSIGAPPRDNNPPDASSPLPTDPEKQHGSKTFPVPGVTRGLKAHANDPQRGSYDPASSGKVIGQAIISGSTKLPAAVRED